MLYEHLTQEQCFPLPLQEQSFPLSFQDPHFRHSFQDPHFHNAHYNFPIKPMYPQEQMFSTSFPGNRM